MTIVLRSALALLILTILANGAYAADPATSSVGEAQAIQGDEGKFGPAEKPGSGSSAATNAMVEDQAIQGDEGKSGPAEKPGSGSSAATNAMGEAQAIQGDEGK